MSKSSIYYNDLAEAAKDLVVGSEYDAKEFLKVPVSYEIKIDYEAGSTTYGFATSEGKLFLNYANWSPKQKLVLEN